MWLHSLAGRIQELYRKRITEAEARLSKCHRVFFIGNGGSAAIASHIAMDWAKNKEQSAVAFNDASLLTCLSNDFGYEEVFRKALHLYPFTHHDALVAISSSGQSHNILNAARYAMSEEGLVVTLSGFSPDNPLRSIGHMNFYVPSDSYGIVEITHLAILHSMVQV